MDPFFFHHNTIALSFHTFKALLMIIVKPELRPFLQLLVSYRFGKTDSMAFVVKDRIITAKENITYRHPVNHC